jgi:hypothetical protein
VKSQSNKDYTAVVLLFKKQKKKLIQTFLNINIYILKIEIILFIYNINNNNKTYCCDDLCILG